MKKLVLISLVCSLFACNQKKVEHLQFTQDSLTSAAIAKDSAILSFVATMNQIQENLDSIKEMEEIVRMESAKVGEGKTSDKEHIMTDIQVIYDLMKNNKELLNKLQLQLGKSNAKVAELQRAIVILNKQVNQKDEEIAALQAELDRLNVNISGLHTQIEELVAENLDKDQTLQQQANTITEQTTEINTVYYAFGTKKELIENDLVDKIGGFVGLGKSLKMKEDFNQDYFTKANRWDLGRIELRAQKVELISNHPSGSYSLEENGGLIEAIVIDDPEQFWSSSKYLVIVVD